MEYIELMPDEDLFLTGILEYVKWHYNKLPHVLIFGSTGSGKTYMLQIILARVGRYIPDSKIILCDYKGDNDFEYLNNTGNFYRYDECSKGLDKAVSMLRERQNGNDDKSCVMLVFDEWASYLNHMDKKNADISKNKLSLLLMLGRSFNVHVIVSQQRADSSYFNNARDNFSVIIGMGKLSKESVQMLFSEYNEVIDRNKSRGHGSIILGNSFKNITVPTVVKRKLMQSYVIAAVNRYSCNE